MNSVSNNVGFTREIQMKLKRLVLTENHPWLDNKSIFCNGHYKLGVYNELASPLTAKELYRDLEAFIIELNEMNSNYTSFVAAFSRPMHTSDGQFLKLLHQQLILLHQQSNRFYQWDKTITSHSEPGSYSFGIAGRTFYIVGLHAKSTSRERRFDYPLVIFNAHRKEPSRQIPANWIQKKMPGKEI